jgi:hypothetical protein
MRERRDDRQLHLSLQTGHDAPTKKADVVKKDRPVVDLGNVRSSRHGANVLERVIREGFTRKK